MFIFYKHINKHVALQEYKSVLLMYSEGSFTTCILIRILFAYKAYKIIRFDYNWFMQLNNPEKVDEEKGLAKFCVVFFFFFFPSD